MLAAGMSALAARTWPDWAVVLLLAAWVAIYVAGMRLIDQRWAEFERTQQALPSEPVNAP
jgi:hypothetical protein